MDFRMINAALYIFIALFGFARYLGGRLVQKNQPGAIYAGYSGRQILDEDYVRGGMKNKQY